MKEVNKINAGLLSLIVSMAIFFSGCVFADGIKGNGKVVDDEREVSGFSKIEISGAFNVFIKQGNDEFLKLEAEENLISLVETEVVGDKLKIYTTKSIQPTEDMNVFLTFRDLSGMNISGACELTSQGKLDLKELDLEASGASEVYLDLEAGFLEAGFSGASEIELAGKVEKMEIGLSGASELDAYELECDYCGINVSGAGNARLFVNKELDAEVSGAADIIYRGNAALSSSVSGAGSIKKN